MTNEQVQSYQCIIVDESQFLTREEVDYLTWVVDDLRVPVICYGLRSDFKGDLFPGSEALLACADIIEEVKTICWCGKKATCNARFDETGKVLKEGAQVVLGANDKYIGLCRKHWKEGNLGPQ
jgi:thymidine kinase